MRKYDPFSVKICIVLLNVFVLEMIEINKTQILIRIARVCPMDLVNIVLLVNIVV